MAPPQFGSPFNGAPSSLSTAQQSIGGLGDLKGATDKTNDHLSDANKTLDDISKASDQTPKSIDESAQKTAQSVDHLGRHLLFRMIAYRLQAERLGDLDRDTQRFLDRIALGTQKGDELPSSGHRRSRHGFQPGSILVREWDGKPQRVMVLDQGFAWNGTTYRSLTVWSQQG